ncbi:glycoside hydrolase family protein [Phaeospirillum tilakii]|uniref:Lysozyme n=1 Tax=Phaeospirillum tilakii TaxID=741673 RepID=A0ABW5CGJ6_9PROT
MTTTYDPATLRADLIRDESLRLKPYRCPAGKLTIGIGRNLDDVGISREEAETLLDHDIAALTADFDRALPWWRGLSEARQRALVNMGINLGLPRLLGFKRMLTALERGEFATAAAEALDSPWAGQVGARAQRIAALLRAG